MKVATYCRISTDEARQPFSLDAQSDRLNSFILSQDGWRLTRSYVDHMSGKTNERPGLQQALDEARRGKFGLLLVFKVDRLSRSMSGLLKILEQLQAANVEFKSASEPFETSTAAGRMMIQLLGVFAEFEREMIVERTKMGLARKAQKGEWTGGTVPFGYRYDKEQRLLFPEETEGAVVRSIFERYVSDKWGSMEIAKWLNDNCELTQHRAYWTPKRIIALLRNPTYVGSLPFAGETYEAGHTALIDNGTFEKAALLLRERGEAAALRRSNPSEYILSNFLQCGHCGHGFVGTSANGKGGNYRYYTCFSRQRHGANRCQQTRVRADRLEEKFLNSVLNELNDGEVFLRAAEEGVKLWKEQNAGRDREIDRIDRRIAQARDKLDRYLSAFERRDLPEAVCFDNVKKLEKELSVLEANRATLATAPQPADFSQEALKDLKRQIEAALRTGTPQAIKELLKTFLSRIVVEEGGYVQPYYCVPGVRIMFPQRTQKERRTNHLYTGRPFWFTSREWGFSNA